MNSVAVVGIGWLGFPLVKHLIRVGWNVKGSKRTYDGVERMRLNGIQAYYLELTPKINADPDELNQLLDVESLVVNIPPSDYFFDLQGYVEGVQNIVHEAINCGVEHIIFISSTSVYPNEEGCFTENSVIKPTSDVGQALYQIETWLLQQDVDCDILRLAGLTGQDRHPVTALSGRTELPYGKQPINLVHRTDCVLAIQALLETRGHKRIYNLVAEQHPNKADYYPTMARRLGLVPPQFSASNSAPQRIIDGSKICRELDFDYHYTDPYQMELTEQTQYFHQD